MLPFASSRYRLALFLELALVLFVPVLLQAQDQVDIFGNGQAGSRTRIAVADFKPSAGQNDALRSTFDTVLYADLANAGIFDLVSKSIAPPPHLAHPPR